MIFTRPGRRSRPAIALALIVTVLLGMLVAALGRPDVAAAAPGDAFTCTTGTVFITQGPDNGPTTLYTAEGDGTGGIDFVPQGAMPIEVNGVGWNSEDGYLYGMSAVANQKTRLVRIGEGGVMTDLGPVMGLPPVGAQHYNQGTFGEGSWAGTLFVHVSAETSTIHAIDVSSMTSTPIALSSSIPNLDDFTWKEGYLWAVSAPAGGNQPRMYRIDPDTGQVDSWSLAGLVPNATYGAQWTYGNGNIGISSNGTGVIYQIAVSNPDAAVPTFEVVSATPGPSAAKNDGASCSGLNVDLSIVKTGPVTYSVGANISYTLTITNNGPGDSSGSLVTDTVPTEITNVTSPTPGCTVTGQDITCTLDALPVGEVTVITVNGTVAASAAGAISNTANVLGNEFDPVLENNESTWVMNTIQVTCDNIWYVTNHAAGTPLPGTYGYVDPSTGTWTHVGELSAPSVALAIDPTDPATAYYNGFAPASGGDGHLYRLDLETGTHTQLTTTPLNAFQTNRMALGPDGRLWTVLQSATTPRIWSTQPTATDAGTPTSEGVILNPDGVSSDWRPTGGDLAFDGNGNMWLIASNGTTGESQLWVISAEQLAGTGDPQAILVGELQGTAQFTGLAFDTQGNLYGATGGSGASRLFLIDKTDGALTEVASGGPAFNGDLASCAIPSPELSAVKSVNPEGEVTPGAVLTYSIEITNSGVLESVGTVFSDQIPQNTTYVPGSSTLNGGALADVGGTSPFAAGTLVNSPGAFDGVIAPGQSAVVTFQVTVNDPFPAGVTEVVNQGLVSAGGVPPFPTNPVENPVIVREWSLLKEAYLPDGTEPIEDGAFVNPGDSIEYRVVATNSGTVPISDVVLTDDLTQVLNNATFMSGSLVVDGGAPVPVAPDANGLLVTPPFTLTTTATLTYTVQVNEDAWLAQLTNVVTGDGSTPPTDCVAGQEPGENCTTVQRTPALLLIEKLGDTVTGPAPLDGAEFALFADNGGTPGAEITDPAIELATATGMFFIEGLTPGTYWLRETKAPDGHNLLAQDVQFTIDAENGIVVHSDAPQISVDNEDLKISVLDTTPFALPLAGGSGSLWFTVGGAVLLAGALAALVILQRRRRRRDESTHQTTHKP